LNALAGHGYARLALGLAAGLAGAFAVCFPCSYPQLAEASPSDLTPSSGCVSALLSIAALIGCGRQKCCASGRPSSR
jgi:hypothetical protein